MVDRVTLSAKFKHTTDRLTILFTVTNSRDGDIYLIDQAFQVGPQGPAIRPDHLSVSFRNGGLAVLSTKLPPFDPSIQWATPPVIYATPVRAGHHYTHEVSALLPLRAEGWHSRREEEDRVLAEHRRKEVCTKLVFELGVILAPPNTFAPASEFAGVAVVRLGAGAVEQQAVLTIEQSEMELPCVR